MPTVAMGRATLLIEIDGEFKPVGLVENIKQAVEVTAKGDCMNYEKNMPLAALAASALAAAGALAAPTPLGSALPVRFHNHQGSGRRSVLNLIKRPGTGLGASIMARDVANRATAHTIRLRSVSDGNGGLLSELSPSRQRLRQFERKRAKKLAAHDRRLIIAGRR